MRPVIAACIRSGLSWMDLSKKREWPLQLLAQNKLYSQRELGTLIFDSSHSLGFTQRDERGDMVVLDYFLTTQPGKEAEAVEAANSLSCRPALLRSLPIYEKNSKKTSLFAKVEEAGSQHLAELIRRGVPRVWSWYRPEPESAREYRKKAHERKIQEAKTIGARCERAWVAANKTIFVDSLQQHLIADIATLVMECLIGAEESKEAADKKRLLAADEAEGKNHTVANSASGAGPTPMDIDEM
jgi:hypothetical protein